MEIWKTIKDYPDYEISNLGRVRSNKRKTSLIMSINHYSNGYCFVILYNLEGHKSCLIHRLVLETFNPIENMNNYEVNHKDCDRTNNKLENLEWVTSQENRDYRDKLKHTPKAESILVQFLDGREDMVFDSMSECAKYFNITRKAINRYLESQNIRSDRKVQAHFYKLGKTSELNKTERK